MEINEVCVPLELSGPGSTIQDHVPSEEPTNPPLEMIY